MIKLVMTLFYSKTPSYFLVLDDWLRTLLLVSSLSLFLCICFKVCNVVLGSVSTSANIFHSVLAICGPEAGGSFIRWCIIGGMWTFIAFHDGLALLEFMLLQFGIARTINLRSNAIAFSSPIAIFLSVFISSPIEEASWFFDPSFGVIGLLGAALLCTINVANTFCAFNLTQAEETYSMVTANRFWSQIFVLVVEFCYSAIYISGLAYKLHTYDFSSTHLRAVQDDLILLSVPLIAGLASIYHSHEQLFVPEEVVPYRFFGI